MGPVLLGLWASTSLLLIVRRIVHSASFRHDVLATARPAEPRIAAVVVRISRRLGVTPPRVLLTQGAVGGAAVIGVRDPIVLLDEEVLSRLDAEELEGVIAHELAHVARRDNLLAWAAAFIRDVTFFVPGSGWAVRALHREREAAADQDAVEVTRRPAALASGLLSVVELAAGSRRVPHGCAALVPSSSVVDRVQMLLSDSPVSSRRHRSELALAAAVSLLAVAVAIIVPGQFTGEKGEREALGVLVGPAPDVQPADPTAYEGRVFDVYRGTGALTTGSEAPVAPRVRGGDLFGAEDRPGVALACSTDGSTCPHLGRVTGLVLRPKPIVLVEDGMSARWQATPVAGGTSSERLGLYWLARLVQGEPLTR
jgi:beta-lactamase regulating signal transducer with metallopeptidase domain